MYSTGQLQFDAARKASLGLQHHWNRSSLRLHILASESPASPSDTLDRAPLTLDRAPPHCASAAPRPKYWQPRLDALAVGERNVSVTATSLVVDSGSTIIFAGENDARSINSVSNRSCPLG